MYRPDPHVRIYIVPQDELRTTAHKSFVVRCRVHVVLGLLLPCMGAALLAK